MWFVIAIALSVAAIAAFGGGRLIRPWVIGIALIGCGFAVHAAFERWVADWAGRIEMGQFAVVEAILFLSGLGAVLFSLAAPRPAGVGPIERGALWLIWLGAVIMTGLAVLGRLPP